MNDVAVTLLTTLLRTTLALSVAVVAVGLVLRLSRAASPIVHRVAWIAVLLQGWLFVGLPLAIPWYEPPAVAVRPDFGAVSPQLTPTPVVPGFGLGVDGADVEIAPTAPTTAVIPGGEVAIAARQTFHGSSALVALWAVGIAACIAAATFRYARFVRRLPQELPSEEHWCDEWQQVLAESRVGRDVPLYVTYGLGPMLCRLPRGYRLVVPTDFWKALPRDARLGILRHELAHYQRGDLWKSLFVRLLALPHWFNPLAWWAVRRFEECGEWACDGRAADDNTQSSAAFAKALLRLGTVGTQPSYHFGAAGRGALARRIRRLLRQERTEDSTMKKALLFACLISLGVIGAIRFQLVAREPTGREGGEPTLDELAPSSNGVTEPPKGTPLSEQMVEVAREGYLASSAAYNAMTITPDILIQSSQLLLKAEQRVAKSKQDQIAALRDYRDRIKHLKDKIEALYKVGARGGEAEAYFAAKYYFLEAEYLLEQAQNQN